MDQEARHVRHAVPPDRYWLDGSLSFTGIITVSALIAVIISGVLVSLAMMTMRRTGLAIRPHPGPGRRQSLHGARTSRVLRETQATGSSWPQTRP